MGSLLSSSSGSTGSSSLMDKSTAANAYENMKSDYGNDSSGSMWSKALNRNNMQNTQQPQQNPNQEMVSQTPQMQPVITQTPGQLNAPVSPLLLQFMRRP